jgi:hypothetical protein
MYCSPQGRIGELKVLKLGQVADAYQSSSSILADDFKTSPTFGYQAILFPPLQRRALTFFLDRVRPSLEAAHPELLRPDSHLFASSRDPTRIADTSRHMAKFFQRTLGNSFSYPNSSNYAAYNFKKISRHRHKQYPASLLDDH